MTGGSGSLLPWLGRALLLAAAMLTPWRAIANDVQTPVDQADPALIEDELRGAERNPSAGRRAPLVAGQRQGGAMTPLRSFTVGAVLIEGAAALTPARFAPAIEPYLGRELDEAELRLLVRDVAGVARQAGYGLATAWIPPQSVTNGVLRVRIDEGRIDRVEATGPARAAVERRLALLAGGRPVRTAELERQLLIAGDLAGVSVGQARIARRGGENVLQVATAFDRVRGRASIDNWGTGAVGPVRAQLSTDINAILFFGDRLTIGGVVTPAQPREFQLAQIGYTAPVGARGTTVSLHFYVGHSAPGAELRDRDIGGVSSEIEASVSHPLMRSRAASLWGRFELTMRDSRLSVDGIRVRDDRIVAASAGLLAHGQLGGGQARARLTLVQGFDLLDATRQGDPLASRADAGGIFTKISFSSQYNRSLGGPFSIELSGEGQLASRPLLASEELGLGGRYFLRGFDFRQAAGDRGVAASAELRFDLTRVPPPLRKVQLYAYADAGRVTNLQGGQGGSSLASAGGGVRAWLHNRIEAAAEIGVPLTDGAFAQDPKPRFSFRLGLTF